MRTRHPIKFKRIPPKKLQSIRADIVEVLSDAWGEFPEPVLDKHILHSHQIIIAKLADENIGFCALSKKTLRGIEFIYIEFLVVKPSFQGQGVGHLLMRKSLISFILRQWPKHWTINLLFITPNIQILKKVRKYAKLLYPNPWKQMQKNGAIAPADKETWEITKELIAKSENPKRKLDREALVLHGSYASAPWLIRNWLKDNDDELTTRFTEKYLAYGDMQDRELVVRAQISPLSLILAL